MAESGREKDEGGAIKYLGKAEVRVSGSQLVQRGEETDRWWEGAWLGEK